MPYTSLGRITDAGLISNSEKFKSVSASDALILAGGGHCHALLLRRWAMQPQTRPNRQIILVSCNGVALYSGLVPALIAGVASREQASINLRWLAQQAGVAFVQATITGLNPQEHLRLHNRPNLPFAHLSLNLGAVTRRQGYRDAISIKPLEPALKAISAQDSLGNDANAEPFHCVGAGLAAVEICLALRQRWVQRPLSLHTGGRVLSPSMVRALREAHIKLSDAPAPDATNTLLCIGSEIPSWLSESGLRCDSNGRVFTRPTLQTLHYPRIFAAGDCAVIQESERPPSGVWAVRAAQPLANNLERFGRGQSLLTWRPQHRALQLLGLSIGSRREAWLLWGSICLGPHPWLWRWKQQLDHRFMGRFRVQAAMSSDPRGQATQSMACRGCAAKLPADPLQQALSNCESGELASQPEDAHPLTSNTEGGTLLASVDGFPALISDPWLNGRLTTLHACSDLWASGARVSTAQAIVTVPAVSSVVQVDLLSQTLAGVRSALTEQGACLIGGHTLESRQASTLPAALDLQVSLSVTGNTPTGQQPWSKGGIKPGDHLLLSRPIGTGVLFAAAMQGAGSASDLDQVLNQMQCSQHATLEQLLSLQKQHPGCIHACTDITGFGLLGHLNEMVAASDSVTIELWIDQLPILPGAMALLQAGISSTLAPANRRALASLGSQVHALKAGRDHSNKLDPALETLLIDPQTCGPLLVSVAPSIANTLLNENPERWWSIGRNNSLPHSQHWA